MDLSEYYSKSVQVFLVCFVVGTFIDRQFARTPRPW